MSFSGEIGPGDTPEPLDRPDEIEPQSFEMPIGDLLNNAVTADETDGPDIEDRLPDIASESLDYLTGKYSPDPAERVAEALDFLDSLPAISDDTPEIPLEEQLEAGKIVLAAARRFVNAPLALSDLQGRYHQHERHTAPDGATVQLSATEVGDLRTVIDNTHEVSVREVLPQDVKAPTPERGAHYEVGLDGITRRTDKHLETDAELGAHIDRLRLITSVDLDTADPREFMDLVRNLNGPPEDVARQEMAAALAVRRQPIGVDEARRLANLICGRGLNDDVQQPAQ